MSTGRPRHFDPDTALERAMETFWARGYDGTSLQTLLSEMGLSKSSLYQSFGDKGRLFDHCLDHYCQDQARRMHEELAAARSGRRFLEDTFYGIADCAGTPPSRRGCLLMNTASEFGDRDPTVARRVQNGVEQFTAVFRSALERAREEGDLGVDRDIETLARYLVANMSGLRNLLKAGIGRNEARQLVSVTLGAL